MSGSHDKDVYEALVEFIHEVDDLLRGVPSKDAAHTAREMLKSLFTHVADGLSVEGVSYEEKADILALSCADAAIERHKRETAHDTFHFAPERLQ